jgi:hypothetical protein
VDWKAPLPEIQAMIAGGSRASEMKPNMAARCSATELTTTALLASTITASSVAWLPSAVPSISAGPRPQTAPACQTLKVKQFFQKRNRAGAPPERR